MKKLLTLLFAVFTLGVNAQSAKQVLDKTAALCSSGAVQAKFTAKGGSATGSGTLITQGNKFTLQSSDATIWFDGKTEWSLVAGSGEVNIVEPTSKEIAQMNPMNFINLYKSGYKSSVKTVGSSYEVHLTATGNKPIKEMYVIVSKTSYKPQVIKLRTGSKNWTIITVNSFTQLGKKPDSFFRFNAKDHPKTRIIDMR